AGVAVLMIEALDIETHLEGVAPDDLREITLILTVVERHGAVLVLRTAGPVAGHIQTGNARLACQHIIPYERGIESCLREKIAREIRERRSRDERLPEPSILHAAHRARPESVGPVQHVGLRVGVVGGYGAFESAGLGLVVDAPGPAEEDSIFA